MLLSVLLLFLCACGEEPVPDGPVVINDPSAQPVSTAAPTAPPTEEPPVTPEPTPEPTAEPTEEPTPEPTAEPTAEPTQQVNPAVSGRKVYITFDDGPCDNTPEVLDILKRYNIKATFFTIGFMVRSHPETAKRIVEEGHLLACHTMTHDLDKIYKSPDAFLADVNDWREAVKNAVGYDAGAYRYRFPGGSPSAGGRSGRSAYVEAMNRAGYVGFDWNVGLNDAWLAGNTDNLPVIDYFWKSYQDTYSWYKNVDPLILIIHDTHHESVELLPRIIDDLIAKGFEFGLVSELDEDYLM